MINTLLKLFVKNYNDVKNANVRERYGRFSSILGIICNVLLCTSKIIVGFLFNNISITADGINNLSDASSSVITLVGFKLSNKPADKDHPFGHARIEYISGLIVTFIILFLGIELIKTSFDKILHPEESSFSVILLIILVLSIIIKLFLCYVNNNLGNKINSTTIKATAKDSLNDVLSTSAVLISVIITKLTGLKIDGYVGMLVAVIIIFSGIDILRDILNPLLGEPPDRELIDNIVDKILCYEGVLNLHDLVVHSYGPNKYFATVHVEVSASEDILISHDMIDNIERDIHKDLDINLVIHLDPIVTNDKETNKLKEIVNNIVSNLGCNYSMHDFRLVKGHTHTNVLFDIVIPNECDKTPDELTCSISQEIKKININYYPVITIDKNYNTK
ncbi:cation transporter [Sedimentibacter sp. zth1]|uniref:cation diffusion facilitator family transporter n=1 Tax=Sedimentibacter sp. zth1 TaxID=2816908 RepID=UPI001A938E48|nr:cation diffusion facilitator family transporter [Sedimentibacter sp. zth1]QSX05948.1 cation transporter [Sedimentibacter sp. zth1]